MDTNRSSIFVKLSLCIIGLFITSISYSQLVVDGIDMMKGFTFGATAESFNPADFQGRHWTVNRTDDPDPFDTEEEMHGSLRWAINKANETIGTNYIDFNLPNGSIILLETSLPSITNTVIIDGKPELNSNPKIIIDGQGKEFSGVAGIVFNSVEYGVIQGVSLRNLLYSSLHLHQSNNIKVLSNIFNNDEIVHIPYDNSTGTSFIMINKGTNNVINGNIIGTDLNLNLSYALKSNGVRFYKSLNQFVGENIISNVGQGIDLLEGSKHEYINNLLYNNGHTYWTNNNNNGYGIIIGNRKNIKANKNLFYANQRELYSLQHTNPVIQEVVEQENQVEIQGVSFAKDDIVEVFLMAENGKDVIKYLGSAVANIQHETNLEQWKWQLIQNSNDWYDLNFNLKPGQIIVATATDVFDNTSEFSNPFTLTNISERIITLISECSPNPSTTRRWKVINSSSVPILLQYNSPVDQSLNSYEAPIGESYLSIEINESTWSGTLQVSYTYESIVKNIDIESSQESCAGVTCENYDFNMTPQHVLCSGSNTGAVVVDLMGASLVSYEWSHEVEQLNLTNTYAGEYTLAVTVLDVNGNECQKSKMVEIREDEVDIKIHVTDIQGCENTGIAELTGVTVTPYEDKLLYKCQYEPEETYPEVSCDDGELLKGIGDVIISVGEKRVVPEGFLFEGNLTLNGGQLVVCGSLNPTNLVFNSGEIYVNTNGFLESINLDIPAGSTLQNFGIISCDNITINGTFINLNDVTCEEDLILNSSSSFINYGDILVIDELKNNSIINNYRVLSVSNVFINQADALLNNYCTIISDANIINDGTINNEGFINIINELINNQGGEINILDGSKSLIGTLENNGIINTDALDCFCFTVLSGTELTENSSILNQFTLQGSGSCDCSYSTGIAYNAEFVELDDERITPTTILTGLTPGEHDVIVNIDGCEVGTEIIVKGGLFIDVMNDPTICEGDEKWIGIDAIGDDATITWNNQESIINYQPNQGAQLVNPNVTTTYTVNVVANNGCSGTASITVNIIPSPELTLIDDQIICRGESVTLNVTSNTPVTYNWKPFDDLSANDIQNPIATADQTKEYEVVLTETLSSYSCTAKGTVQVEVKPSPEVTVVKVSDDEVNCENSNVQLEASGALNYNWTPTEGLSDATISNPVASPASITEYIVTGTAENGCNATASITVEKANIPVFEIGVDETSCISPQRQLYVRGAGVSFNWSPAEFLDDPNIAEPKATVNEETAFTVEITTEDGCVYLKQLNVNKPSWPIAENITVDFGVPAQLVATGGVEGTYRWSPSYGLSSIDIPNPVSNVQATTVYELTAENIYGCENTINVYVYVDPTGRCLELSMSGKTYYWTGSAGNNDWNNPSNWDDGSGSNGVPGSDPTQDNVIIEFLSGDSPNYPKLIQDVEIHRLCFKGGELDLASYMLLINGDATFTGGEIKGVTTANAEALKLVLDGSGESQSVYFGDVTLNCNLSVISSPEIYLNGATFNGFTVLEQNGNNNITCAGGNNYNNETQIINSGTGLWQLAYINGGTKDTYNADVTFKSSNPGTLFPNSSHHDEFKGDIYFEGESVVFGSNGGITFLSADVDQYIGGQTNIAPVFRKLIIEKNLTDGENVDLKYADVYLEIPIQVGLDNETEDKLVLNDGIIFTTEENILTIPYGVTVEGASGLSFIEGPIRKIGNEDFIFPVGKADRYLPIKIQDAVNPSSSTEFIAEFIDETPEGSPDETLQDISSCEYWRLTKPLNDADEVTVTLFWDRNSCDISTDVTKLKVTSLSANIWNNLGILDYTGSKSEGGSIIAELSATYFEAFAIGSDIIPGYGSTVGMSLNNYGANISVDNCEVFVNGNVLNENDEEGNPGTINNSGTIIIANDWTNNAQKEAFGTALGIVNFNGNYQRIRGSQPTVFNELLLAGFGKKEMFNNVDVNKKLKLFDNQLEVRDYSLFIKTNQFDAIENNTGFVSSMDKGYIARILEAGNNQPYLFPVGGHSLYRPVYLTPLDDGDDEDDIFRIRFIYHNPSNHDANTEIRSASVNNVNQNFFYEIEKEDGTGDNDHFSLVMRYNKLIDGAFQSIGHWDENPKTDYIGNDAEMLWLKLSRISPSSEFENTVIPDILNLDNISDFDSPKFALIKGAFIINTDLFGDPFGDGSNVDFTMSGDGFTDGEPIYDSENPEIDGVGQPVAPSDMTVEHEMLIFGDPLTVGGRIFILTDGNGDIKLMDGSEDQYEIRFLDGSEKKPLAKDLYIVKNGNILELHQEPKEFEIKCNTDLKVSFSETDPLVFKLSNPHFTIEGTGADKVSSMVIINAVGVETNIDNPLGWSGAGLNGAGVYKFELNITTSNGSQKFKGQFIVEN